MTDEDLKQLLQRHLNIPTEQMELIPLHAHASYRSYLRLRVADGATYVVMIIPKGKWSVSEEVSNQGVTTAELPFLNMTRYLLEKDFPIAKIIKSSEQDGLIILQDLGDRLLENEFKNKSLDEKCALYKNAISLLVDLQNRTGLKDNCIAFERRFDEKLLVWELNHFFEYGIEVRTGKAIESGDKSYFSEVAKEISHELMQQPQVFVHRDFQSRNLMLHHNKLWLIDFQDALVGPISYDLVALLRDSYIVLDRRLRESLIDEFLDLQNERYQQDFDRSEFTRWFDWTTIQRKLKDAGRFVFIDQEKGNSDFLQYIPDTLAYIKEALTRRPELKEFYERLKKYVPEWN